MNRTERLWSFRQLPSDAQGNRVLKEETGTGGVVSKRTWYVRDAAGQHLTTYEQSGGSGTPRAKEYLLYGSSRLGTAYADNANGGAPVSGALYRRVVGQKQYELGDHLGNVRATVGDIKVRSGSTFAARVASYTEYFPFGMVASTATVAGGVGGRFGFNGQERVDELKGPGNHNTAEFWEYDTRAVQRFNMDPRPNMEMSPYAVFAGNPVMYSDAKGDTIIVMGANKDEEGNNVLEQWIYTPGKEYEGSNKSIKKIVENMNLLIKESAVAEGVISNLSSNPETIFVEEAEESAYSYQDGTVYWNESNPVFDVYGQRGYKPRITLLHELAHAYDFLNNISNILLNKNPDDIWATASPKVMRFSEIIASHIENLYRTEVGLALRKYYGFYDDGSGIESTLLLQRKKSKHVKNQDGDLVEYDKQKIFGGE